LNRPIFVDTNVHLYAFDAAEPSKRVAAQKWRESLWQSGRGRTSFQVLQEFYSQSLRKFPSAKANIRAEIQNLLTWRPVLINAAVLEASWAVQDRYRIAFWDALIVAAAQVASCRYLLTEDLQSGQVFGDVEIVDPFSRTFESLDA
jgi:predicted nucleic acid-binding protein